LLLIIGQTALGRDAHEERDAPCGATPHNNWSRVAQL